MENLSFSWDGSGSLFDCLKGPFTKASTPAKHGEEIFSLKLWLRDGRVLIVHSRMHDLYDREEVGVLAFSETSILPVGEREFTFEGGVALVDSVMKVATSEAGYGIIDCGVVLHLASGQDIAILAGGFPCSLAVKGMPRISEKFHPEYPLDRYRYEPWVA